MSATMKTILDLSHQQMILDLDNHLSSSVPAPQPTPTEPTGVTGVGSSPAYIINEKESETVMKLEDIGFYTLSDERARTANDRSPLQRCELIITDRCNFKCPYCRGLREDLRGSISREDGLAVLKQWCDDGLVNVRFSGGEPTLHPDLIEFVEFCVERGARVAISTNGSAPIKMYDRLLNAGVTDFSISLDAGCCAIGIKMMGLNKKAQKTWDHTTKVIRYLSTKTYVTTGMVFNELNVKEAKSAVLMAHDLGVADIRIISSAQYNGALTELSALPEEVTNKHPILKYRIDNCRNGVSVRGIPFDGSNMCRLVLDDMAVAGGLHFPCIIYMREGGQAIGTMGPNYRRERSEWFKQHRPKRDSICSQNCLDVCIDYNRRVDGFTKFQ